MAKSTKNKPSKTVEFPTTGTIVLGHFETMEKGPHGTITMTLSIIPGGYTDNGTTRMSEEQHIPVNLPSSLASEFQIRLKDGRLKKNYRIAILLNDITALSNRTNETLREGVLEAPVEAVKFAGEKSFIPNTQEAGRGFPISFPELTGMVTFGRFQKLVNKRNGVGLVLATNPEAARDSEGLTNPGPERTITHHLYGHLAQEAKDRLRNGQLNKDSFVAVAAAGAKAFNRETGDNGVLWLPANSVNYGEGFTRSTDGLAVS